MTIKDSLINPTAPGKDNDILDIPSAFNNPISLLFSTIKR